MTAGMFTRSASMCHWIHRRGFAPHKDRCTTCVCSGGRGAASAYKRSLSQAVCYSGQGRHMQVLCSGRRAPADTASSCIDSTCENSHRCHLYMDCNWTEPGA